MQPVQGESKKAMLMAVAGGLLALGVLAIALIGFLVLGNGGDDDDDPNANPTATSNMAVIDVTNPPTLTTEPTVEASPTVDDVVDAPTTAPSLTVEVNPTTAPSLTSPPPTGVPTSTLAPPTDAPTITIAPPSPTAEPTQPQGEATVLYPDGKRFVLLYNYTSFYMLNRSGENFSISRIAFEALDSQDQAVMAASSSNPIAVEGGRWARFYPTLENNNCVRAEISNASGWLRPEQCGAYNATITPTATDSQGFWRVRSEPTVIFRVMLDGQEIARCPLADETSTSLRCEFRIP